MGDDGGAGRDGAGRCDDSPTGPPPPDHVRYAYYTEPINSCALPACYFDTHHDRMSGSDPAHAQAARERGATMYFGGFRIAKESRLAELAELYAALLALERETDVRRIATFTEAIEAIERLRWSRFVGQLKG